MSKKGFVAFDLGAESGRAMLATLDGGRVAVEERHRFANLPVRLPSGLHWNLYDLWNNLVEGLGQCGKAAAEQGVELAGGGVDTWGVDFGLVGKSNQLLTLPFAYRDERNAPAMEKMLEAVAPEVIYEATGIQFMPFNTLVQLLAQREAEPGLLEQVEHFLMMPDLLHFFFTGEKCNEATDASTTQMIDPRSGQWAVDLLAKLDLPTGILGNLVPAGTPVGRLRPDICEQAGVAPLAVIAPASHDTASAVAAVPAQVSDRWAYLSSGTWSLMGVEIDRPIISEASRRANFTNEGGAEGKIRFLKNIAGLWLVQECRRHFQRDGQDFSYSQLTGLAADATSFRTLVDPDDETFLAPGDMPLKIAAFAGKTNQPLPETPGQFVRCCLESLALAYRQTLDTVVELTARPVDVLHIVGGGGRNELLNQMTADATGRLVIVGPYEATAIGNALVQAMGLGELKDLAQIRQVVRASFDLEKCEPRDTAAYDAQMERFARLRSRAA